MQGVAVLHPPGKDVDIIVLREAKQQRMFDMDMHPTDLVWTPVKSNIQYDQKSMHDKLSFCLGEKPEVAHMVLESLTFMDFASHISAIRPPGLNQDPEIVGIGLGANIQQVERACHLALKAAWAIKSEQATNCSFVNFVKAQIINPEVNYLV